MAESTERNNTSATSATVLIIDDNLVMLEACREILEKAGYRVLVAEEGAAGVERLRRERQEIDLIILDWMLPTTSGDEWLAEILRIDPKARVIFATGHIVDEATRRRVEPRVRGFLRKPFAANKLLEIVQKVLAEQ